MPAPHSNGNSTVSERTRAGGIGSKKVDVTWATEEAGLLLGVSVKTINFRDRRSGNFQKNLTNRRGDLLFESVTLHRRFPYAVLGGFLFLDIGAASDDTEKRNSTFVNAHKRLELFTGRDDPQGRDEQYERLHICLLDLADPKSPAATVYLAGEPDLPLTWAESFDSLLSLLARRNPDHYEFKADGSLGRA